MTIANTFARRMCTLLAACGLIWGTAQAQTVIYYHTDALGSPVATTDASGNVLERTEYEPYGQVLNPPVKDGPGYTGHVSDAQTGLSYMQQRYYDPQIGRFLSMDPVTADAKTGGNFNRYWYANNNPYRFNDPDGRVSDDPRRQPGREQKPPPPPPPPCSAQCMRMRSTSDNGQPAGPRPSGNSQPRNGFSYSSVFSGDTKPTFTGVAAAGVGIKAEKKLGPGNDRVALITPALGLGATTTWNVLTLTYDFGGGKSAPVDTAFGPGGMAGLGLVGAVGLKYTPPGKFELNIDAGFGAAAAVEMYEVGYRPGATGEQP